MLEAQLLPAAAQDHSGLRDPYTPSYRLGLISPQEKQAASISPLLQLHVTEIWNSEKRGEGRGKTIQRSWRLEKISKINKLLAR